MYTSSVQVFIYLMQMLPRWLAADNELFTYEFEKTNTNMAAIKKLVRPHAHQGGLSQRLFHH